MRATARAVKWAKTYDKNSEKGVAIPSYLEGDEDRISISAKWIRENVGADVAVDYLKAMEED